MRICLLATADNPHTLRWARYLAGRGHQLLCLCDRPGPSGFSEHPPCEIRHPQPNLVEAILCFKLWRHQYGWFFFRSRAFRNAVQDFEPDIVHGMEALAYGYAVARCRDFARVLTPWGNDILCHPRESSLARWLVSHALNHVEAITTNMPNLAESIVEEFGVDPERVRPFSWGIDLEVFHPGYEEELKELRSRWGIPSDALVFLSNRQIRPYWGIGEIAGAIPLVLDRHPRCFFVFLRGKGDPEFEKELQKRIDDAGCGHRVRWVSELLTDQEMAVALNLSDAFISVPRSDLLSISVLEGMACGSLPIVADHLAYRPRLHNGENAIVVPTPVTVEGIAEACLSVAAHPHWISRFAGKNIDLIREHDDWSKNARKMEDVYHWAIDNPLRKSKDK